MKSNEIFILLLFYFACQVVNLIHQFLKKERNKINDQCKIFKINSFGILCIIVTRIPLKPFKTIVLWELNQIGIWFIISIHILFTSNLGSASAKISALYSHSAPWTEVETLFFVLKLNTKKKLKHDIKQLNQKKRKSSVRVRVITVNSMKHDIDAKVASKFFHAFCLKIIHIFKFTNLLALLMFCSKKKKKIILHRRVETRL